MKKSTGALTLATIVLIGAGCLLLDRLVMRGRRHNSSGSSLSQQSKLMDASGQAEQDTSKAEQEKKEATDEHLLIIELMLESLVGRSKRIEEKIKNLDTILAKTKRLEEKLDRNNNHKKDVEKLKEKGKKKKQKKPQSGVTFGVHKPISAFSEGPVAEISIDLMRITGEEHKGHSSARTAPKKGRRERREPWDYQSRYDREKAPEYTLSNGYGSYNSATQNNKPYGKKNKRGDYGDGDTLEYQNYASSNTPSYDLPPTFQLPENGLGSLPFGTIPFSSGFLSYPGTSSPSYSQKKAPTSLASPKPAAEEESNSLFPAEDDLIKTTEFDTYEHLKQYNEAIEHGRTPEPIGIISSNIVRMGDLGMPLSLKSKSNEKSSGSSVVDPELTSFRKETKDKQGDFSKESKKIGNANQAKIVLDQAPGLADALSDAATQQQTKERNQKNNYSAKDTGMNERGNKLGDNSRNTGSTFGKDLQDTNGEKPNHSGSLNILDQALGAGLGTGEKATPSPTASLEDALKKPMKTKEGTLVPSGGDSADFNYPATKGKPKDSFGTPSYKDESYTSKTKKSSNSFTSSKDKSVVSATIVQQKTTAPVVEIVTGSDSKSNKEERDKLFEKIKQLETRLSAVEEKKNKERDEAVSTTGTKQPEAPLEIKLLPIHSALPDTPEDATSKNSNVISEPSKPLDALKNNDESQKPQENTTVDNLAEDSKKQSETELKQEDVLNGSLVNGLSDFDTDLGIGDGLDLGSN